MESSDNKVTEPFDDCEIKTYRKALKRAIKLEKEHTENPKRSKKTSKVEIYDRKFKIAVVKPRVIEID